MFQESGYGFVCMLTLAGSACSLLAGCPGSKSGGDGSATQPGADGATQVTPGGGGGNPGTTGGESGSDGSTATACGQPGTPCCDGNSCSGGGCCVSGICMAAGSACVGVGGGICNAGTCGTCGGAGLPCCASTGVADVCTAAGTRCSGGTCAKCGEIGTSCCAIGSDGKGTCSGANTICGSNDICVACGAPGGPCCSGSACNGRSCCYDSVCIAESGPCGTSGGTCQSNRCSGCGATGQACCGASCYDGLLCKSGACAVCGGLGQDCCPTTSSRSACQAGSMCTPSDNLCRGCGNLGETCCPDNSCSAGCCSNGRCTNSGVCPSSDGGDPVNPSGDASAGAGGRGGAGGSGGSGGGAGSGGPSSAGGGAGGGTAPDWSIPPGCGDGVLNGTERCDDGNNMPFDGCSSDCQSEPICTGSGPCTSRCGDGIVLGEECDDGNMTNGDGCSSSCTIEVGFSCSQPALGNVILVPVVYRDFRFGSPSDFEPTVTGIEDVTSGLVESDLDSDGKPVYTNVVTTPSMISSKTSFASWYRNVPGTNHATPATLPLFSNGGGAYVNRWGSHGEQWPITEKTSWCGTVGDERLDKDGNPIPCTMQIEGTDIDTDCDKAIAKGEQLLSCTVNDARNYRGVFLLQWADGNPTFFPVDGDTFTPTSELAYATIPPPYEPNSSWPHDVDGSGNDRKHNFSFTSEVRYWFRYESDKTYTLDIAGDDDVWVFINKKLALDLGGIHVPASGSVTLNSTKAASLGLSPGHVYEVAVFQAERQTNSSTFKITLSGFNTAASTCVRN